MGRHRRSQAPGANKKLTFQRKVIYERKQQQQQQDAYFLHFPFFFEREKVQKVQFRREVEPNGTGTGSPMGEAARKQDAHPNTVISSRLNPLPLRFPATLFNGGSPKPERINVSSESKARLGKRKGFGGR